MESQRIARVFRQNCVGSGDLVDSGESESEASPTFTNLLTEGAAALEAASRNLGCLNAGILDERKKEIKAHFATFLGWRPSLLGWRPSLLGWRPSLIGWRPSETRIKKEKNRKKGFDRFRMFWFPSAQHSVLRSCPASCCLSCFPVCPAS